MTAKLNILFLCTGNSARSQMAEAWLKKLAPERFNAYSAGTAPRDIHPLAVRAMQEVGCALKDQQAKSLEVYLGKLAVHYLIVVCDKAQNACPRVWPGVAQRLYWPFEDPAQAEGSESERLAKFREVREQIRERLESWLAQIK
jgi:arsenate reductase